MEKEKYERIKTADGEEELCDLIIETLTKAEQEAAKCHNDLEGHEPKFYWRALALKHAIQYVEDWKNSI